MVTPRRALLVVVALAGLGFLLDAVTTSDEEALAELVQDLARGLEAEDPEAVRGLLLPDFHYQGPAPIDDGDIERLGERLLELADTTSELQVVLLKVDPKATAATATVPFSALVRFRMGDLRVPVRADVVLDCERLGPAWRVVDLRVTRLQRGVL